MKTEIDVSKSGLITAFEKLQMFPDPADIQKQADAIRGANPSLDDHALAKRVVRAAVGRSTGVGVVAGLPGAIPGIGIPAQLGVDLAIAGPEVYVILRNVLHMQYLVAGIFGHDLTSDERQTEALIVFGLQAGLVTPAVDAGVKIGSKIAVSQFNRRVSGAMLRKLNTKLGAQVFTKFGAKRGGVAIGRLIPFGVGMAIGGGANFLMTKAFGRHVLKLYGEIIPSELDLLVID